MTNFINQALELLGRPGNAVRSTLAHGPEGFLPGLMGDLHTDPVELPFISGLPDEGPQMGPFHFTPRTMAGFAAGAALDPATYVLPPALGKAGEMMGLGAFGQKAMQASPLAGVGLGMADDALAALGRMEPEERTSDSNTETITRRDLVRAALKRNQHSYAPSQPPVSPMGGGQPAFPGGAMHMGGY